MQAKRFCYTLTLAVFFLLPIDVAAQQTSVDLEYRFNPTYSRGYRRPLYSGEKAGFFSQQRTRLILNYNHSDSLKAKLVLQDRRAWGEVNERADVAEVAIFRAWIEKRFSENFSIKLGRQGLIYNDQHLFGELNWGGTLAHDLMLNKYESDKFKLHLGLAFNANRINELTREPYAPNFYKNMQFLWLNRDREKFKTSFFFINRGLEGADTTVLYTQTFGPNISYKFNGTLSAKGVYYHQIGRDITDREVNANFISLQLTYKPVDNFVLTLGMDKVSGTDQRTLNDAEAQSSTFDILYGLRHGRFGYLDYFYLLFDPVFGLQDYYLQLSFSPSKTFNVKNHVHLFNTDASVYSPGDVTLSNPLDSFIGMENDLLLSYKWSKDFKASFGHSIMFGSTTLDDIFGGTTSRDNQFYYMVITVAPRIFESKKK